MPNNIKPFLTQSQITCLKNQAFNNNEPGTLLKDFTMLLDFIGTEGISVSEKNSLLPIKLLSQINQQLSTPLNIDLKRPVQKSYPAINGLYLLLRASGLAKIENKPKATKLVINEEVLASWNELNATERYFNLLTAWWYRGSEEILGERNNIGWFDNNYYAFNFNFLNKLKDGIKNLSKYNIENLKYSPGLYQLALLELFGMLSVEYKKGEPRNPNSIIAIKPTEWGKTINDYFYAHLTVEDDNSETEDENPIDWWWIDLKKYIPAWQQNLKQPTFNKLEKGGYVFKVSLHDAVRKIVVPYYTNLNTLAGFILKAFNFDNDHLYEFRYKNYYGITESIAHPYVDSDNELCTDDCAVGDLPFFVGMEIIFHFDFGDDWEFHILVESVVEQDSQSTKLNVIEKQGKPPKQYGKNWN